jgi:hypothetical protein
LGVILGFLSKKTPKKKSSPIKFDSSNVENSYDIKSNYAQGMKSAVESLPPEKMNV